MRLRTSVSPNYTNDDFDTSDIVKLITLPDRQQVPDVFESSVKVVAGARNHRELTLSCSI